MIEVTHYSLDQKYLCWIRSSCYEIPRALTNNRPSECFPLTYKDGKIYALEKDILEYGWMV